MQQPLTKQEKSLKV